MRVLFSLFLLLLGSLFLGITVDNSIVGNSIVKIFGASCLVGFWKTYPKSNDLY